jgi:hypothetical protein
MLRYNVRFRPGVIRRFVVKENFNMYACPASLLRLPPPRRMVIRGEKCTCGNCVFFRASICDSGPSPRVRDYCSPASDARWCTSPQITLRLEGGRRKSEAHEAHRHYSIFNFTYGGYFKIENKHDASISRALYLSIETAGLPNLVRLSLYLR